MLDNLIYLGIIVCGTAFVLCVASIAYQGVLEFRYRREMRERLDTWRR